ncbi:MAG: hypothetical protein AAGD43_36295 [Pseudomonadota bacterium]
MRDPKAAATPAVRARAVDYSPQLQATRSLQRAGNSVSKGFEIAAQKAQEYEDHETKLKLAEFRLQTERDLEDHRKTMAPGAAGWESGWQKAYTKRADKFIKALPATQRQNAHAALTRQYERLGSRANSLARGEARRFTIERLETSLTGFTERVDRDPSSLNESRQEARRLVESADLSLAQRKVLLKRTRQQLDRTALTAKLASAKDIGSLNALDQELAGSKDAKRYTGPFKYLSVAQRRSVRGQIETQKKRIISKLGQAIDKLGKGAIQGILPEEQVAELTSRVAETGDTLLKTKLSTTVATAREMKQRAVQSPLVNMRYVTDLRSKLVRSKGGGTREQVEHLEKLESFARNQANTVKDNQLSWSFRSGVTQVAQLPADLGNAERMEKRLEHVIEANERFRAGLQYFTVDERTSLSTMINSGQVSIVKVAGNLVKHWGLAHANRAIRELAKNAPESVIAGWLVANNVNQKAAADIDEVLRTRKDLNYVKPKMELNATEREAAAQNVLGDVFDKFPAAQRMAIIRAADLLYEKRQGEPGVADAVTYQNGIKELMGERTDQNGHSFGGVLRQGGYWSSDKYSIIVPPSWRRDSLKDVLSSLKKEDLQEAGLPLPVDKNGKRIPITRALTATMVQAGSELGIYYLSLGDPNTPGEENYVLESSASKDEEGETVEAQPYRLDLNKLETVLRKRMSSRFWSG